MAGKRIRIDRDVPFSDVILRYGDRAEPKSGNVYLRFDFWVKKNPDGSLDILAGNHPDDLSIFIAKAGLGGDNPKIIKSKP